MGEKLQTNNEKNNEYLNNMAKKSIIVENSEGK